jgi:hypothetical protein
MESFLRPILHEGARNKGLSAPARLPFASDPEPGPKTVSKPREAAGALARRAMTRLGKA